MPPIAYQDDRNDNVAPLSNEDVQLLDKIIRRAQESINAGARIFDSLFAAYEFVFNELGLDTSHDKAVFRFLFRLGQPSQSDSQLYDRFEQLLAEQNIVLEFEDDTSRSLDAVQQVSDRQACIGHAPTDDLGTERRPSRRASFTSLYDTTKELTRQLAPRASSRSSISRLDVNRKRALSTSENWPAVGHGYQSHRPRLNRVDVALKDSKSKNHDTYVPGGTLARAYHPSRRLPLNPHDAPYPQSHSRLSESDLVDRADTYHYVRLQGLLHLILRSWAVQAAAIKSRLIGMEKGAAARDRRTLLHQAFDLWRATYRQKVHERETERFFEHLYLRAGRARDLYLLMKAFSHWRIVGEEEAARTGAARRHVLRIKYFHAWRDITVINELKAQRQEIKRPFTLLRKRFAQICENEVMALSIYHRNLTRLVFFRWFWSFCDAAVPRYRETQTQKKLLHSWVEKIKSRINQERLAHAFFVEKRLRKPVRTWATAARIDIGGHHQAQGFRKQRLLGPILQKWHAEAKVVPMERGLTNLRDWRIARTCFSNWTVRYRMSNRAETVDKLRLMRNSWTVWNDELRTKAIQAQMHERVKAQFLYKWVLHERYALMCRIYERGLRTRFLNALLQRLRSRKTQYEQHEKTISIGRRNHAISCAIKRWSLKLHRQQEDNKIAYEYCAPRLELESITAWRSKLQLLCKYDNWAKDAHFYFSANRALKQWSTAAREAQKKRRQTAYGAIRKMVKTNLAKQILSIWRTQTDGISTAQEVARNHADDRIRNQVSTALLAWHSISKQRVAAVHQARINHNARLLRVSLSSWHDMSRSYQNLESRAFHFHHIHLSELCSSQLRKLSLRAFEILCREQAADATRDRHFDKHIRRMFKHWTDRTRSRMIEGFSQGINFNALPPEAQQPQRVAPDLSSVSAKPDFNTRQAEEWTAFDDDVDLVDKYDEWIPPLSEAVVTTSTPAAFPGYLSTPSKRAVRARALANLSTTPAGMPPIRTPFVARLRGEQMASATPGTDQQKTARRVTFDESRG